MGLATIIVYSLLAVVNLYFITTCFLSCAPYIWQYFCYLTLVNLMLSTIYLLARVYIETIEHILKKEIHNGTKHFWYSHYYKYNFVINLDVFCVYWMLCLLGKDIMAIGDTLQFVLTSIYMHGVLCLVIFCDIFMCERSDTNCRHLDFKLLAVFILAYCIMLSLSKYVFDFYVYPFMNIMNFQQTIVLYILIALFSFNMYQLYHYILSKTIKENSKSSLLQIDSDVKDEYVL